MRFKHLLNTKVATFWPLIKNICNIVTAKSALIVSGLHCDQLTWSGGIRKTKESLSSTENPLLNLLLQHSTDLSQINVLNHFHFSPLADAFVQRDLQLQTWSSHQATETNVHEILAYSPKLPGTTNNYQGRGLERKRRGKGHKEERRERRRKRNAVRRAGALRSTLTSRGFWR